MDIEAQPAEVAATPSVGLVLPGSDGFVPGTFRNYYKPCFPPDEKPYYKRQNSEATESAPTASQATSVASQPDLHEEIILIEVGAGDSSQIIKMEKRVLAKCSVFCDLFQLASPTQNDSNGPAKISLVDEKSAVMVFLNSLNHEFMGDHEYWNHDWIWHPPIQFLTEAFAEMCLEVAEKYDTRASTRKYLASVLSRHAKNNGDRNDFNLPLAFRLANMLEGQKSQRRDNVFANMLLGQCRDVDMLIIRLFDVHGISHPEHWNPLWIEYFGGEKVHDNFCWAAFLALQRKIVTERDWKRLGKRGTKLDGTPDEGHEGTPDEYHVTWNEIAPYFVRSPPRQWRHIQVIRQWLKSCGWFGIKYETPSLSRTMHKANAETVQNPAPAVVRWAKERMADMYYNRW